jgi:hypothetical protein
MGIQDVCVCRLFFHSAEKDHQAPKDPLPFQPGEELMGEMSTLQELGLQNGGRVEV